MPADAPREQLASIAAVTGELDRHLDEMFASVARLKELLARTGTDAAKGEAGPDDQHTGPA
jgi:hypothetical protein